MDFLPQEILNDATQVIDLQSSLLNLTADNIDSVISKLANSPYVKSHLSNFLQNVFVAAEYRPFSVHLLVRLCSDIENVKPLLLQSLSNPAILNIEQMYFLSVCRDSGIITNDEVNDCVRGKKVNTDLFKSCFFNNYKKQHQKNYDNKDDRKDDSSIDSEHIEMIPLEGESIEQAIRNDSVDEIKACFNENENYQADYRIVPSIQFGCHFLRNQPTLIQYAAFCGSVNAFKYLLEIGANIDLKDLNGRNLAAFAMAGGNKEIISILKDKKVDFMGSMKFAVRFRRNELFEFIEDDPIPLLHHCTASNNIALILKCLEKYSSQSRSILQSCLNQPDQLNSNTPIQVAAEFNALDALNIYLNCNLVNINSKNKEGQTALHIAASKDYHAFVKNLLSHEMIQQRLTDSKGRMALHVAAENGHIDIVRLFLESGGVTVNSRTDYGATPLHMSVSTGNVEMAEYLLTVDNVDAEATTLTDETPIHFASQNGQTETVELLLNHGVNPNVSDKDGWTPLHYATQKNYLDTIDVLLVCEKTNVNAKNRTGWTPLHLAAKMGNLEIVNKLLATKKIDINQSDNDGWAALHFAAKNGDANVVQSILEYEQPLTVSSTSNNDGNKNSGEFVKVNVNQPDKAGWTPLHDAVKYQNHEVVQLLLKCDDIDVNARTSSQWVPLHIAYLNHDQKTKDMLEAMPNVIKDAKDSEGRTPEDLGRIPVFGSEGNEGDAPTMVYFNGC